MLVFKYLLRVFKYLTIAYGTAIIQYALPLITLHILDLFICQVLGSI